MEEVVVGRAAALAVVLMLMAAAAAAPLCCADDPTAYFHWDVSYVTASPLGVPQQVIAVAKQFPGPIVKVTTNWNVVVNVRNSLDEDLLLTWDGIQMRKNCWNDGVLGTNCPIPPGWNWTYDFQVKDQIGSFFYFPSLGLQRAAGGYGGIVVNSRDVVAVPFDKPDGDITLFIGDWYIKNHTDLRKRLDDGKDLGVPDGVLMNGKGPYRYNATLVPDGIDYETINVEPGDHPLFASTEAFFSFFFSRIESCFGILRFKSLFAGPETANPSIHRVICSSSHAHSHIYIPVGILRIVNLCCCLSTMFSLGTGKTYRFRIHNVGISTSLNFRIQNHNLLLVETEGTHTLQQSYASLDVHVGQSYSFLVTMDQSASSDYYIVASARFVNESLWTRVTGVAILHYSNSRGKASGPLPDAPDDFYYKGFSMNQARSIRTNLSAGAARPNPQGSFRYGLINVTQSYLLRNTAPVIIDGKLRTTLNGISYSPPTTPLRLADQHNKTGVYTLDFPSRPHDQPPRIGTSVINGSYRGFMEIVFQNDDTRVQTYHIDGYSAFVVGMDYGEWTEDRRATYNKWDAVYRSTTQVFPGAWTAVYVSLDNVGIWNVRAENLDTWYLGQEAYMKIVNPERTNKTELPVPDDILYCGLLQYLQKYVIPSSPQAHKHSSASSVTNGGKLLAWILLLASLAMVP
ncbi:Multicopper oxidase [Musa troglodytarum]|uniref:Multicopper oxidase n=1 Tax=Musa troglodytarum TaxID=320322 RepID=A0A9E7K0W4_9LILI|nr:Multicopper oxidase [Musa troglodytarum]